jgi:hypothetical protein
MRHAHPEHLGCVETDAVQGQRKGVSSRELGSGEVSRTHAFFVEETLIHFGGTFLASDVRISIRFSGLVGVTQRQLQRGGGRDSSSAIRTDAGDRRVDRLGPFDERPDPLEFLGQLMVAEHDHLPGQRQMSACRAKQGTSWRSLGR